MFYIKFKLKTTKEKTLWRIRNAAGRQQLQRESATLTYENNELCGCYKNSRYKLHKNIMKQKILFMFLGKKYILANKKK